MAILVDSGNSAKHGRDRWGETHTYSIFPQVQELDLFRLRVDLDHDVFDGIGRNRAISGVLKTISHHLEKNPTLFSQEGKVKTHDDIIIAEWKIE